MKFIASAADGAHPLLIRPPGALAEGEFLETCIRCGLCVRDCPYDTLKLAELGYDGPATGTPYFVARTGPCEMCEDIPCAAACPPCAAFTAGWAMPRGSRRARSSPPAPRKPPRACPAP
mgnify:CR=1 FL=1